MRRQHVLLLLSAIAIVAQHSVTASAESVYLIDAGASRATIHVGKAGVFSFAAGHTHEVNGPVQGGSVDIDREAPSHSRIRLVIATADLKVSPSGEPEGDAPKVQAAMESDKVLDVSRYPRITFASTAIAVKTLSTSVLDATVTGQLTIRDVTQSVVAPVHVQLGDNSLIATGRFVIKQTAFGIKPISVAGVVNVKDTLDIEFTITAKR